MRNNDVANMKTCVVVLGMHGGGTSAVAGMLAQAGVDFGPKLHEADEYNPKGYFEDPYIFPKHDELLCELGTTWFNPGSIDFDSSDSKQAIHDFQSQMVSYLNCRFADSNIFGIKEPRFARILPIWKKIFREISIQTLYVIIIREPAHVVRSIIKRDMFDPYAMNYLWAVTMLEAERLTRNEKRIFISYECLLENPLAQMNRIIKTLNLDVKLDEKIAGKIESFIDPALNRSGKGAHEPANHSEFPIIMEIYHCLKNGAEKEGSSANVANEIDEIWQDESKVKSFNEGLKEAVAGMETQNHHFLVLQNHIIGLYSVVENNNRHILNMETQVKNLNTAIMNRDQSILDLRNEIERIRSIIKAKDMHIQELQGSSKVEGS